MLGSNLRIGTKLAAMSTLGAVLVLAMIGNQLRVHFVTQQLAADERRLHLLETSVRQAELDLRRLAIQAGD